ncbi:MAG: DUF4276 family protein [Campylobacterota bacterium]|nr:DUF4276 family protein [Campylobacterota bacterium]
MINLYIIVEGPSEEKFIKEILAPYFANKNIFLHAECVITGKNSQGKACKGGGSSYEYYKNHISKRIKQFKNSENYYFSTMIDFYALPKDFPKLEESKNIENRYKQIKFLEEAFESDIQSKRFIPYLQLHEFETLLFVNPSAIVECYFDIDSGKLLDKIKKDIESYDNIEMINSSEHNAPSKRLDRYTDGNYCNRKVSSSFSILKDINIESIKESCRHFNDWIESIESISTRREQ